MDLRAVPARIVAWQVVVGCVGGAVWLVAGIPASLAAFAGGLGSALLSFYFMARVFSRTEFAPPQAIVAAFYRAEAFKLLAAVLMFGLVARYFTELFLPFLSTYAASLLVYFAALLWQVRDGNGGSAERDS